jgi:ABC-type cobalamin transport system ATPase subunit
MTNAIEIRGLIKNYPAFTLGPLDLTVPRGAIYGLIGPNGAGKTTAIDLVFGMGRNDAGTIRVFGLDHRADEVALKRRAAYVNRSDSCEEQQCLPRPPKPTWHPLELGPLYVVAADVSPLIIPTEETRAGSHRRLQN